MTNSSELSDSDTVILVEIHWRWIQHQNNFVTVFCMQTICTFGWLLV